MIFHGRLVISGQPKLGLFCFKAFQTNRYFGVFVPPINSRALCFARELEHALWLLPSLLKCFINAEIRH